MNKAAGPIALYETPLQTHGSDSEHSPFQPSQQCAMMQHRSHSDGVLASSMNSPAKNFEATGAPRRGRSTTDITNYVPVAPVRPSNDTPYAHSQTQPRLPLQWGPRHYSRTKLQPSAPSRDTQLSSNVAPAQAMPIAHTHPHNSPQLAQVAAGGAGLPNWQQVLQSLEWFKNNTLSTSSTLNAVDVGRLDLLREAIEKHDLFYVCLNYIHSRTFTPATCPRVASRLSMQVSKLLRRRSSELYSRMLIDKMRTLSGARHVLLFQFRIL